MFINLSFFYEWLQFRNASRNSRKQRNSQLSRSTSTGNHLVHLLYIKLSLLILYASFLDWSVSIDTSLSNCITFCYHICVAIVGRVIHVHVAIQQWINIHNCNIKTYKILKWTNVLLHKHFTSAFWLHKNLYEFTALKQKFERWFVLKNQF